MIDGILKGIMDALWGVVTHVPIMIWVVIAVGIIGLGILMRYLTNIKVDLYLFAIFVIVNSIIVWRAHWINQGYDEAKLQVKMAEEQMEGYKKTEQLIQACYARNTTATVLWDRTKGACVRADGAH